MNPSRKIAILAYGSLIVDPGSELKPLISNTRKGVETPFPVEYARSSQKRGGAPTLIPYESGSPVKGTLLILNDEATEEDAVNKLYRREIHEVDNKSKIYVKSSCSDSDLNPNKVYICSRQNFNNIETVLYTKIGSNITPLTPQRLAELAVCSAKNPTVPKNEDGISYLLKTMNSGIITPLTAAYKAAILQLTRSNSLKEAIRVCENAKNNFI